MSRHRCTAEHRLLDQNQIFRQPRMYGSTTIILLELPAVNVNLQANVEGLDASVMFQAVLALVTATGQTRSTVCLASTVHCKL